MITVRFDRLDLGVSSRVLDVGAGSGRHAFEAGRRGHHAVAVDLDPGSLKDARDTAELYEGVLRDQGGSLVVLVADARSLPFPDGSFDAVICSEVLEHVYDDQRVIDELYRVLRPGGVAALTVPRFWPEVLYWLISREYHSAQGGHIRIFRPTQLQRRAQSSNLRPLSHHHSHALHTPYWLAKCLSGISNRLSLSVRVTHWVVLTEIMGRSRVLSFLERIANPLMGKSLVLYVRKSERASRVAKI